MKRILSMDGGGLFGIVPAVFVAEIERRLGKPVSELFDLVAGTSAGGINALGLVKPNPLSGQQAVDFYHNQGTDAFRGSWMRTITSVGGLLRSKYAADRLEEHLQDVFDGRCLCDASVGLLVPSFDVATATPVFFREKSLMPMWAAARATAAAPYYLPPFAIGTSLYADGALFADNPSLYAMADARRRWPEEDLLLVSLGTGKIGIPTTQPGFRSPEWGLARWAYPLAKILMASGVSATDEVLEQGMASNRYFRLDIDRVPGAIDNPKAMLKAQELANLTIAKNGYWFDRLAEVLS